MKPLVPECAAGTVEHLFQLMLDTPRPQRVSVLEAAVGGDSTLRERVLRLVEAFEGDDSDGDMRAPLLPPETEAQPLHVGRYKIESVLAEGGVSIVYLARQHQPARAIALKVIRPHFASQGTLSRFTLEAEVLGRLRHPGIAHVYDAGDALAHFVDGHTETRAFLAMELVEGPTLTALARERSLSVRERVSLMAEVCDAVHAAHQQGVLHRDLKPANIVVDATGRPKVLDFGAACLAAERVSAAAIADVDMFIGTGPYLSPEHASGDPRQIDIRSDVYSLGVILYELLAGETPIDVAGAPIQEVARRIQATQPTPLEQLIPSLRGDLSLIVGKTLCKEKNERYQSAAEFAADLRRHLNREPVLAHAPGIAYELRMFAARRPRLVATLVVGAASLVATAGAAVLAARAAAGEAREKVAALQQVTTSRDEAEAAATFLEDVLTAASPDEAGRDVRLRDLLGQASATLEQKFKGMPAAEARAREAIGRTFLGLGDFVAARSHLERAYTIRLATLGDADPVTAHCGMALGAVLGVTGESEHAAALYARALEVYRQRYPRGHPDTLSALNGLASVETDRQNFGAALQLYREATSLAKERGDALTDADLRSLAAYAETLRWVGQNDAARAAFVEVLPKMRAQLGKDNRWTLSAVMGAAALAASQGRTDEAERMYREVLEARTRVLGPDHGDTLGAMNSVAMLLAATGRFTEAEELYQRVIEGAERALGPTHRNTLKTRFNLAQAVFQAGRYEEASTLLTRTLAAQRDALGPRHVDIADSLQMVATANARLGHADLAADQFAEAIDMLSGLLSPEHQFVLQLRSERGACLMQLSRYAEAEEELQCAVRGLMTPGKAPSPSAARAVERLAACREAQGRAEAAAASRDLVDLPGGGEPGG